jgi:hypothetical protein
MKITVVRKGSSTKKKPRRQNFCPWLVDDYAPADKKVVRPTDYKK